jgi:hypothetical protein
MSSRPHHLDKKSLRQIGSSQHSSCPRYKRAETFPRLPSQEVAQLCHVGGFSKGPQDCSEKNHREAKAVVQDERMGRIEAGENEEVGLQFPDRPVERLIRQKPPPRARVDRSGGNLRGRRNHCFRFTVRDLACASHFSLAVDRAGRKCTLQDRDDLKSLSADEFAAVGHDKVDEAMASRRKTAGETEGRVEMTLFVLDQKGDGRDTASPPRQYKL